MSEKPVKKVKKVKKKVKAQGTENKGLGDPGQFNAHPNQESNKNFSGSNLQANSGNKVKNQGTGDQQKAKSHKDRFQNEENIEQMQNLDLNDKGVEIRDFKLRFKKSVLYFQYNENFIKVPIYLKGSVLFIVLLEKLYQILDDFSQRLQDAEKQFISDMNLYLTYFSLISGKIYSSNDSLEEDFSSKRCCKPSHKKSGSYGKSVPSIFDEKSYSLGLSPGKFVFFSDIPNDLDLLHIL